MFIHVYSGKIKYQCLERRSVLLVILCKACLCALAVINLGEG